MKNRSYFTGYGSAFSTLVVHKVHDRFSNYTCVRGQGRCGCSKYEITMARTCDNDILFNNELWLWLSVIIPNLKSNFTIEQFNYIFLVCKKIARIFQVSNKVIREIFMCYKISGTLIRCHTFNGTSWRRDNFIYRFIMSLFTHNVRTRSMRLSGARLAKIYEWLFFKIWRGRGGKSSLEEWLFRSVPC